jgi:hypothetical protein
MPTVELSETLVAFLRNCAERGHGGDINDFLHSHFRLSNGPKRNDDRTIRDFISSHRYTARVTPAKKYMALLSFLAGLDIARFNRLEGFVVPGTQKILVSSDAVIVQRRLASAKVQKIDGSDFFALLPAGQANARDFADHILAKFGYPIGVRQEVKRTLNERIDLSILDI